jgi:predicted nucleic acid-binding protein
VVTDAGPVIHLDELGCLNLLDDIGDLFLPFEVWSEIKFVRPTITSDSLANARVVSVQEYASAGLVTLAETMDLHRGETLALMLAEQNACEIFLCDDAAARLAAESLGLRVHGTVGIIIRSIRTGRKSASEVLDILKRIPSESSLHIAADLLAEVIDAVRSAEK